MSGTAVRRIQKELADVMASPMSGITVVPDEDNILLWQIAFSGPKGTPYAGGKFAVTVQFANDYPFKAPTILFKTKMYHPNIDSDGNICIGVLKAEQWKPSTKMSTILLSIYDLIETPNPDDPLVTSIAEQYRSDRKAYDKRAQEYASKYAT
ncbi:hypothetical protein Q5752_002420 [Cryptotrichosporon argae]